MSQRSPVTFIVTLLLFWLAGTFAWAAAPTITSFAPARGVAGTVVTITGTDLNGATAVAFNGVPVKAFNSNSATSLIALVPEGATSGKITVTNASGTAISISDFAVLFGFIKNPKDGASMVWVPGGTFTMGSTAGVGFSNDEYPAHQVTLSGYWIYLYDVTVAQYRAFCAATKHELPHFPQPMVEYPTRFDSNLSWAGKTGWDDPGLQQHPIVNVTWFDAKAYAEWAGVTLPTEAQWEYAARGPRGNNFPWSGTATKGHIDNGWDETKCANIFNPDKVDKSTRRVGSFPAGASWCGAQDMAGNVMQWCGDWGGDYAAVAVTNPIGPNTGDLRVLRGSSWYISDYRSADRSFNGPGNYSDYEGFRCVSLSSGPRLAGTFTRAAAPTITTIAPPSAVIGTVITITGTDLAAATAVTFNGIAAKTITDNTATSLKVTVPEGATSGKISVTTADGTTTTMTEFTVKGLTTTSISPPSAVVGTVVTITGTDLAAAKVVTFNGIAAKTITDNTATALKVTVPKGATSGKLRVTTATGTVTSVNDFIVYLGLKTNAKDNAAMLWVPGVTFTMGSADGVGEGNEHPPHQVTLSGYWIYQYDVTVAQYRAFSKDTEHRLPKWPGDKYSWKGKTGWDDPTLQQHPIVNVTWNDAKAYAEWAGVTLPTEAQWEYAARGLQGRNYPWGGTAVTGDPYNGWDATKCANYENSRAVDKSTWPIGSFPAETSWCGAQDMAGNVLQWCDDWYGDYAAAAVTNPIGPNTGDLRVLRGGSWYFNYGDGDDRSTFRHYGVPDLYNYSIGFRCCSLSPGP